MPKGKKSLFDGCRNFLGPVPERYVERLRDLVTEPTAEKWDRCHGILVGGNGFMTLWQAVCAVDPTFPTQSAAPLGAATAAERWPRIPDQLTLVRAVTFAKTRKSRAKC